MRWPGLPLLQATNKGIQGGSRDFLYYRLRRAGKQGLSRTFSVYPAVQSFAPSAGGRRSLPGAARRRRRAVPGPLVTSPGRSQSSSGRFRASKRLAVPGYFQGCPTPRVDGPHVECGKWRQLLAEQLLYPGGHLAEQLVERSVQGLTSCFQRSELSIWVSQ